MLHALHIPVFPSVPATEPMTHLSPYSGPRSAREDNNLSQRTILVSKVHSRYKPLIPGSPTCAVEIRSLKQTGDSPKIYQMLNQCFIDGCDALVAATSSDTPTSRHSTFSTISLGTVMPVSAHVALADSSLQSASMSRSPERNFGQVWSSLLEMKLAQLQRNISLLSWNEETWRRGILDIPEFVRSHNLLVAQACTRARFVSGFTSTAAVHLLHQDRACFRA